MSFSLDFTQDKPDIREPIPAGTVVLVEFKYTPGGADPKDCPPEQKEGALTKSKPSATNPNPDTKYLKSEFTVLRGPYKGRKFWSNLTTEGGKVDEKGNSIAAGIARKTIRAILDSSAGLSSKDESPEAQAKRKLTGFKSLQGRRFICTVKIEKQAGHPDKNGLGYVLTIDSKQYPKTEAELDRPVQGAGATEAPAAPIWGAAPAAATVVSPPPAQQTAAAPAPVVAAAAPTPAPQNDAIPAWAKAA